jgi:hypothetical protein
VSEKDAAEEADYVIGPDGRLHFTKAGRAFHTAYFGYAGIDIRRIATEADYQQACHQAFPYLFAFMSERLAQGAQTLETRALRAIVADDEAGFERALRQLKTRERLTVVSAPPRAPRAR